MLDELPMSGPTTPQSAEMPAPSEAPTEPPLSGGTDELSPDTIELPGWLDFLRNRVILGGLGVVVTMLLLAIVLVALGGGDGGVRPQLALGNSTSKGTPQEFRGEGLAGRMLVTVSMRNGPGATFPVLGVVARGTLVSVIGRDADENWLQIVTSAGIPGWVPASTIEVTGDIATLDIGAEGPGPSIVVPTQVPGVVPVEPVIPLPPPIAPPPLEPTQIPAEATSTPLPPPPPPPTAPPVPAPTATPPGSSGEVFQ